jgi:hypothetical protein
MPVDCERRNIMGKLEDWDKATKAKQKEQELYKSDAVYRFLTNQIGSASSEIWRVKQEIKKLSEKQIELKRGRAALVELRQDLLSRKKV